MKRTPRGDVADRRQAYARVLAKVPNLGAAGGWRGFSLPVADCQTPAWLKAGEISPNDSRPGDISRSQQLARLRHSARPAEGRIWVRERTGEVAGAWSRVGTFGKFDQTSCGREHPEPDAHRPFEGNRDQIARYSFIARGSSGY